MKNIIDLTKLLNERKDFQIYKTSLDGGFGIFTKGSLKGATVVWSYAEGWEHVSMCPMNRCPDWNEMCELKDMFWNDDEAVMEIHPAKSDYVNNMKNCLHLWRPIEQYSGKIPLPPDILVGVKELGELG